MSDYISRADAIDAVVSWTVEDRPNEVMPTDLIDRIKALPSADAPKGDLISRQWLLELYGDYIGDNGDTKYHVPLEVVRQNIKDAPSADAVHGEWIKDDYLYKCSVCGNEEIIASFFCPNCGSDMRNKESDTE